MPCQAHEVKKPICGTFWGGGGWINENSVGLDLEKYIFRCPSAWLMGMSLMITFSTPKNREGGYLKCPAGLPR